MIENITRKQKNAASNTKPNILLYTPHDTAWQFKRVAAVTPEANNNVFGSHLEIIGPSTTNSWHEANTKIVDLKSQDAIFLNIPANMKKAYDGPSMAEQRLGQKLANDNTDMQFIANAILIIQRLNNIAEENGTDAPDVYLFKKGDNFEDIAKIISEQTGSDIFLFNDERINLDTESIDSKYGYKHKQLVQLNSLDELKKHTTTYAAPTKPVSLVNQKMRMAITG